MQIRIALSLGAVVALGACVPGGVIYLGAPVAELRGTVYSLEDREPLNAVEVCVQGTDTVCVRSNPDGTYKAFYPGGGVVSLQFRAPGMRPAMMADIEVVSPEILDLLDCTLSTRLTLSTDLDRCREQRPGEVRGVLTSVDDGSPLDRVEVCTVGSEAVCTQSSRTGVYSIFRVTEETADIWFRPGSMRPALVEGVRISQNTIARLDCGLAGDSSAATETGDCVGVRPAAIRGVVLRSSRGGMRPASGVQVCAAGMLGSCTETGRAGVFNLYYPIAETVQLSVGMESDQQPTVTNDVVVVPGEVYRFTCQLGEATDSPLVTCEPVSAGN